MKLSKGKSYEIRLGNSLKNNNDVVFNSFRYNFKPGSINEENDGKLVINSNSIDLYLGSQRFQGTETEKASNSQKVGCALIFDKNTESFVLEKISSNMYFKHQPLIEKKKKKKKRLKVKIPQLTIQNQFSPQKPPQSANVFEKREFEITMPPSDSDSESSSSSESESGSDDDDDDN